MQDFLAPGLLVLCAALTWFAWRGLNGDASRGHGALSYAALVAGLAWGGLTLAYGMPRPGHRLSQITMCASNLKQQSMALIMYAEDESGTLPPAAWYSATAPYRKNDLLVCSSTKPALGYGINDRLLGKKCDMKDYSTILLGESVSRSLDATIHTEADLERRHDARMNIAFADSSVRRILQTWASRGERWGQGELADFAKVKVVPKVETPKEFRERLWGWQFLLLCVLYPVSLVGAIRGVFKAPKHRVLFWNLTMTALAVGFLVFLLMPVSTY